MFGVWFLGFSLHILISMFTMFKSRPKRIDNNTLGYSERNNDSGRTVCASGSQGRGLWDGITH